MDVAVALILGGCLLALVAALVFVVRVESNRLRDELTAARLERAELLQRIQAPQAAAAMPWLGAVPASVMVDEADTDDHVERQWAESDESVIPFDDDLDFDQGV